MKKITILPLLLTVILLTITTTSINADAGMILSISDAEEKPDGHYIMELTVDNNPGIWCIQLSIKHPEEVSIESLEAESSFGITVGLLNDNPCNVFIENPLFNDSDYNGKILRMNFKLDKNAQFGDYNIEIDASTLMVLNTTGETIPASIHNNAIHLREPPSVLIDVPIVPDFVYDGITKTAIMENEGYTAAGNTATDAGSYSATLTLKPGFRWADGTSGQKTVPWSISKAVLTATYPGESVQEGRAPALQVTVTGFVNGETAATAAGYKEPTVWASDLSIGEHQITPSNGFADNYKFNYVSGTLNIEGSNGDDENNNMTYTLIGLAAVIAIVIVVALLFVRKM